MESNRKRTKRIQIWLSDKEYEQAKRSAEEFGVDLSTMIRMSVRNIRPIEKPDERFHEEMNRILEMANMVEDLRQQFVRTGMPDRVGLEEEVRIWKQFRREIQKRYLTSPEEQL